LSTRIGTPRRDGPAAEATSDAVREYPAVLDDAVFGAATEVVPQFESMADLASRLIAARLLPLADKPVDCLVSIGEEWCCYDSIGRNAKSRLNPFPVHHQTPK
jgi:hypothetical protein